MYCRLFAGALLGCSVFAVCAIAGNPIVAPVKSLTELQAFLQQTPEFPLNCLPPDAKRRFLDSLVFTEKGLGGFGTAELAYGGFSSGEIEQIFALLGYPPLESLLNNSDPAGKAGGCRATQASSMLGHSFDVFYSFQQNLMNRPLPEKAITSAAYNKKINQMLEEKYRSLFAPVLAGNRLDALATADLTFLFRAAFITSAYSHGESYRQDMQRILAELERRQQAGPVYYSTIYGALIGDRAFIEARNFRYSHPALQAEELPEVRVAVDLDETMPSVLVVSPDEQMLYRQNFDFQQSAQVVVIASPYCHFCEYAVRDIQADPVLREIFQEHASWLAPPEQGFELAAYQRWNRDCPGRMTALIYRAEEWPMLAVWNTPTFYFFKQDEVVAKLTGWPEEGYRSELLEGLRRIGLVE